MWPQTGTSTWTEIIRVITRGLGSAEGQFNDRSKQARHTWTLSISRRSHRADRSRSRKLITHNSADWSGRYSVLTLRGWFLPERIALSGASASFSFARCDNGDLLYNNSQITRIERVVPYHAYLDSAQSTIIDILSSVALPRTRLGPS